METISHYRIKSKLGSGGMGEVYLAEDLNLRRPVAVKILPADFARDEHRKQRFMREAHAASVLNHPNVGVIYEVGETGGTPFIAMEYVEGQTLDQRIGGRPLDTQQVVDIAMQAADALDAAHSKGITHRDIKSSNIMITSRGHVKVLDFGLAKIIEQDRAATEASTRLKTGEGAVLGTVHYMSPEQALGREVDHRSDIFSLGVVLYEMATGRLPFSGRTSSETIELITHGQPEAVARLNYAAPTELERIIRKCLEKDPEWRYQSARDLLIDLKSLKRDSTSGERAGAVARPHRRRLGLALGVGFVMVLLGLAAVVMLTRRDDAPLRREAKLKQVTFDPGLEEEPTVSPDGRMLAYVTDERGDLDVRILPLGGGQPISVGQTDADEAQPAWSPDGTRIAFVSARDHGGRLQIAVGLGPLQQYVYGRRGDIFLAPALGGEAMKLVEEGYYPAWSADGSKIVFQSERGGQGDLWVVHASGGTPKQITKDEDWDYHPSWSPDGKWIVYGTQRARIPTSPYEVRVVPAEGGPPHVLTTDQYLVVSPTWSHDGKQILFSSNRGVRMNLWKIPFSRKSLKQFPIPEGVTFGEGDDISASPSSRGEIAFATVKNRGDIWELDVGSGQLRQITFETPVEDYPRMSPDGKTLMVMSNRGGEAGLWTVDAEGKLLSRLGSGFFARWSPDGRQIAFTRGTAADTKIMVQRIGDVSAREIAPAFGLGAWSPDGRHVVYERRIPGDKASVFVKPVAGGAEKQILTGLATTSLSPDWSPDGKWIAFQGNHDGVRQIWMIPSGGGTPRQLTRGESESSHPEFHPKNPDQILYLRDHKNALVLTLSTGAVKQLTNFTDSNLVIDYPSWSPDGRKIYFGLHKKVGDIFVLENY